MEYKLNQFFLKTREWLCSFFVNFFSWSVSPFDWPLPSTFFSVLFFYIILTYIISHICQCSFSLCLSVWLNAQKYCALYNTMQIRVHDVQYIYCKWANGPTANRYIDFSRKRKVKQNSKFLQLQQTYNIYNFSFISYSLVSAFFPNSSAKIFEFFCMLKLF